MKKTEKLHGCVIPMGPATYDKLKSQAGFKRLTLKAPRKILGQTTIYFCFLFFRENNA